MNQRWKMMLVACACFLGTHVLVVAEQADVHPKMESYGMVSVVGFANIQAERKGNFCNLTTNQNPGKTRLTVGLWGGEHIRLEVTTEGATVEYDCAHGTISQRIVVNSRGRFVVDGAYVAEHGGPVRMNEQAGSVPVRFTGQIRGKRMTLTVRRSDTKKLIGTFTLLYGQESALVKCR